MRATTRTAGSKQCSGRVAGCGPRACSSHPYLPAVRPRSNPQKTQHVAAAVLRPSQDEQSQPSPPATCQDKPAAWPSSPSKLLLNAMLPAAVLWLSSAPALGAATAAASLLGNPVLLCCQSAGTTAWNTLITAALALLLLQAASPSAASVQRAVHNRLSSSCQQATQLIISAWAAARKSSRSLGQLRQSVPVTGSTMSVTSTLHRPCMPGQLQPPARQLPTTRGADVAESVHLSPAAQAEAEAVLTGGLTGTTIEQVRSYAELTADSGYNPAAIMVRNRALATAAALSVTCVLKECQPQVQQALDCLQPDLLHPTSGTLAQCDSMHGQPDMQQQDDDSYEPVQRAQEAAIRQLVCRELNKRSADMDSSSHRPNDEELQLRMMKAVAAQAALEEVHALISVIVATQQGAAMSLGPGSTPTDSHFSGGISRDTR